MTKKLFDIYSEKIAKYIFLGIRAVTFGNLYFNTCGAIICRFKGNPTPDSNVIFEMVYFACNFIIISPFIILRNFDKNALGRDLK